jgi:hypothetical protein
MTPSTPTNPLLHPIRALALPATLILAGILPAPALRASDAPATVAPPAPQPEPVSPSATSLQETVRKNPWFRSCLEDVATAYQNACDHEVDAELEEQATAPADEAFALYETALGLTIEAGIGAWDLALDGHFPGAGGKAARETYRNTHHDGFQKWLQAEIVKSVVALTEQPGAGEA